MPFPSLFSATSLALLAAVTALVSAGLTALQIVITLLLVVTQMGLAVCLARRTLHCGWPQCARGILRDDVRWTRIACTLLALTLTLTALHLMWATPDCPPARRLLRAALQWAIPMAVLVGACAHRLDETREDEARSPQTQSQARR
jgi:hypothetical protein